MSEFIQALTDPAIPFLRYALITGLLASIAFGVMGSYVVVKKISYLAGAIAHCVLGGIGLALFLQRKIGIAWAHPTLGAIVAALLAAVIVGWVNLKAREREDTVIGAIWAVGMAVGILFLAITPGYVDPMSYLFGNILLISPRDIATVAGLDVLVLGLAFLFYNNFLAVCFDPDFAALRGVKIHRYYLLLLLLTALTIVLLISIVGIVMVVAMLTLPPAIASHFTRRLTTLFALSTALSAAFCTAGLAASYSADLPGGATIILIAGSTYLLVATGATLARSRHSKQTVA